MIGCGVLSFGSFCSSRNEDEGEADHDHAVSAEFFPIHLTIQWNRPMHERC